MRVRVRGNSCCCPCCVPCCVPCCAPCCAPCFASLRFTASPLMRPRLRYAPPAALHGFAHASPLMRPRLRYAPPAALHGFAHASPLMRPRLRYAQPAAHHGFAWALAAASPRSRSSEPQSTTPKIWHKMWYIVKKSAKKFGRCLEIAYICIVNHNRHYYEERNHQRQATAPEDQQDHGSI